MAGDSTEPGKRRVSRIHPELDAAPKGEFDEIGELGAVAGALREALVEHGSLPAEIREVRATVAEVTGERATVTEAQIEALVSLGVLGRISSAGREQLVWMSSGAPVVPASAHLVDADAEVGEQNEQFQLDLQIDIETERLLLYRVGLAGVLTVAIVMMRELIIVFL